MIFSHRFKWVFLAIFYFAPIVDADEWIWAENHPVNSKLPQFSAVGTDGEMLGIDQFKLTIPYFTDRIIKHTI